MKIELINKSKNRYWNVENINNHLQMVYGQINGKTTLRIKKITQKNIGKANETSLEQQALNEIISLAKEKIDAGYELVNKTNIQELDGYIISDVYFPMLANKYNAKLINPNTAIAVQYKLDGVRCIAYYKDNQVILKTRKGKDYIDLFEIKSDLEKVFRNNPDLILDGEIYYHGWDFQRIVSACKARNSDTPMLEYHIFDCINSDKFYKRYELLQDKIQYHITRFEYPKLQVVKTYFGLYSSEIERYLTDALQNGYEGLMIRLNDCKYVQDKRSNQLLKYKQFQDEEFEIIGYNKELLSNQEYGIIYCVKITDDVGCDVKPKGDNQSRMNALKDFSDNPNKYLGKLYTVRFQGYTDIGNIRFPVGVGIKLENS